MPTRCSDAFECHDPGQAEATRGCQPWEVVEAARAARLDFLAITDHNTTSHHADRATLQEGLHSLLLLRGQELTTFHGHANVYGTSTPVDFRLGFRGRGMGEVMRDVAAMEVVNGPTIEGPTAGLGFWHGRLNEGHRITAIGGSDDHAARSGRGRVGRPTTVVWARELSEAALLDGLRSGRAYIRARGAEGPVVDLSASWGGRHVAMGGTLDMDRAAAVGLRIDTARAAGQTAELVRNGALVASVLVASSPASVTHSLALQPGDWVNLRLRDATGITAISNPVYIR